MKKTLLFGAAAILALSANAQTLTKVWEHSMADYTTGETRDIAALGDYAVVPNKTTGMVELWDATGKVKEYDVNTWTAANEVKANPDDANALALGTAVATDEVGNIIVNLGFPDQPSSKNFVAIKPDGSMFHIPCEYPAGTIVPEVGSAGRMDYLGDVVPGDITSNAFIITCPNGFNQVVVYCIYEGEFDASYSYALKIGDDENTDSWDAESSAFALESLPADAEKAPKFIARRRGIFKFYASNGDDALMPWTYEGEGSIDWSKATTNNYTVFTVGGKSYAVVNQPDDGVRTHSWEVFNLATAESLARWTMPAGEASNYSVGFASSVNADGTVNIYQFNPGIRLAKYVFDANGEGGVEGTIATDANAPVKYYNLQGVEIANPENGLFIKKQGAKAEKVIL